MTSIPPSPLPVVLSLEPGLPGHPPSSRTSAEGVITIPITIRAERANEHPSWDELIGNR